MRPLRISFGLLTLAIGLGWIATPAGPATAKLPTLSITGASVTEGDGTSVAAVFMLRLSRASGRVVTVRVATADNSADAGSDYAPYRGVVRFRAGQRSKRIAVRVLGDTRPEPAETFYLSIVSAKGATLRKRQAAATIAANDLPDPFSLRSTLSGALEIDDPRSPSGHGAATLVLDPEREQVNFTLAAEGMTLGDSGLCRGPAGQTAAMLMRFGEPTSSTTVTGTRNLGLKEILEIYDDPAAFCVRATNPDRTEFIRGQLSRT